MTARNPASPSPAKAWSLALERTASIARQPSRTLPVVIDELARTRGSAPALLSRDECLTFRMLGDRMSRYARWAVDERIAGGGPGNVVALLMPNCPDYMAIWLGITSVGGVVALLNTNLTGAALAHCISAASATHIIVDASLAPRVSAIRDALRPAPALWIRNPGEEEVVRIESADDVPATIGVLRDRPAVTIRDRALCIYTSGTTGWPKAAIVSHGRLMQWTHWFAGLMDVRPDDRMYNCLPMYHSVGGVVAAGAALVGGASVLVRDRFSARRFWSDIVDWDCTLFQYVGELCRYIVSSPPDPHERRHRLRLCCGNGLAGDVWTSFAARFDIPQILEFYASTEGTVSLFNVEAEPGAIGRVPQYLAHRFPMAIVAHDPDTGEPVRGQNGRCVECGPGEIGEALGPLDRDSANAGSWFEGYTDARASAQKIVRGVRTPDDAWVRTGDLMRTDARGFVYFVDRIGDTFRWKGENVSTSEVGDAIRRCPGVDDAAVYGVAVPGADGRAGMAAIVASEGFDLAALRSRLASELPEYARPLFVRMAAALDVTGTFRRATHRLAVDGFNPHRVADPIFIDDRERGEYVRLDARSFDRIFGDQFQEKGSCTLAAAV